MKPRIPRTLVTELVGDEVSVTKYVALLREHMTEIHAEIIDQKKAEIAKLGMEAKGSVNHELFVGDYVLVRTGKTLQIESAEGIPAKFTKKVYDGIFKVTRKVSPMSFFVERASDTLKPIRFGQPVNAERLVKISLPLLSTGDSPKRHIEVLEEGEWMRYLVAGYGKDGQVRLEGRKGLARWRDLSGLKYRWIEADEENGAADGAAV